MESLERLVSSIAQVELLVASLKRENRDLSVRLGLAASERLEARTQAEAQIEALRIQQGELLRQAEARVLELRADLEELHAQMEARIQTLHSERLELEAAAEARFKALQREAEAATAGPQHNPETEARASLAESLAQSLVEDLNASRRQHGEEKSRLESLIRQMEAQLMATQGHEELPVASAGILAEAHERERSALDAQRLAEERAREAVEALEEARQKERDLSSMVNQAYDREQHILASLSQAQGEAAARTEAQERAQALSAHLKDLQARLDSLLQAENAHQQEADGLKSRLAERDLRLGELEQGIKEQGSQLNAARHELASSAKLELEQADLKRQRREVAAFAKERQQLRRKVEELLATLESVRL